MSKAKQNALLLLSTVGVLILILAMSLPNLVLSPGQPFSLGQPQPEAAGTNSLLPGGDVVMWILRGLMALALILFPLYIVYSMLTPEGRQRLAADVILFVLLFLLATYLHDHPLNKNAQEPEQTVVVPQDPNAETGLPTSVFEAAPPPWLTPVVILIVSTFIVTLIFVAGRFFRRRAKTPEFSLGKLAVEAQNAIVSLNMGNNLKVTVIQCYREMSRIVKEEKGIERDTAMTAREFEDWLISRGLPQESIRTLTRLFEQVRYGSAMVGTREENLALSCLTEIVNACKAIGDLYESG